MNTRHRASTKPQPITSAISQIALRNFWIISGKCM